MRIPTHFSSAGSHVLTGHVLQQLPSWRQHGREAPPTHLPPTSCSCACSSVWTACTLRMFGCGNSLRTDSCSPLRTSIIIDTQLLFTVYIKRHSADDVMIVPICTCSSWLRDTNADVSSTQDTWMLPVGCYQQGRDQIEHQSNGSQGQIHQENRVKGFERLGYTTAPS